MKTTPGYRDTTITQLTDIPSRIHDDDDKQNRNQAKRTREYEHLITNRQFLLIFITKFYLHFSTSFKSPSFDQCTALQSIELYQVDAFTDRLLGGNPAAVCPLDQWLSNELLQNIAAENFLPETVFIVPSVSSSKDTFEIKWFTPEIEMDLCGHATLAAAHVLFDHLQVKTNQIRFHSNSGELIVEKHKDLITLNFPSRMPVEVSLPEIILQSMGMKPMETWKSRDYLLVYDSEETIKQLTPNIQFLNQINWDPGGIIITAKADETIHPGIDFVSRFFTPQSSILEDPVTGSAHCSLIPYWSSRLHKNEMIALQLSKRTGKLYCQNINERVLISGRCRTYLQGRIHIDEQ